MINPCQKITACHAALDSASEASFNVLRAASEASLARNNMPAKTCVTKNNVSPQPVSVVRTGFTHSFLLSRAITLYAKAKRQNSYFVSSLGLNARALFYFLRCERSKRNRKVTTEKRKISRLFVLHVSRSRVDTVLVVFCVRSGASNLVLHISRSRVDTVLVVIVFVRSGASNLVLHIARSRVDTVLVVIVFVRLGASNLVLHISRSRVDTVLVVICVRSGAESMACAIPGYCTTKNENTSPCLRPSTP